MHYIFFLKIFLSVLTIRSQLTDFCPLGCYQPIKNIDFFEKFSQKSLFVKVKR